MCILCQTGNNDKILYNKDVLQCNYCSDLVKIPDIKGIKSLWCHDCKELTEISCIQGLEELYCFNCPKLTEISEIHGLRILDCTYCPSLVRIPEIQTLERIDCTGCGSLTQIPMIRKLQELYCPDCEKLNLTDIRIPETIKYIGSDKLQWRNSDQNLTKLIVLQKWFKNVSMSKKLIKLIPLLMPLYYHPEAKGGYFHKKEMLASLLSRQ